MLRSLRSSESPGRFLLPGLAAFTLIISAIAAPADSSFNSLLGAWSGSGQVRYLSGDTETRVGDPMQERVQRHRDSRRPDASRREGVRYVGGAHLQCIGRGERADGRRPVERVHLGRRLFRHHVRFLQRPSANRGHHHAGHPDEKRQRDLDEELTARQACVRRPIVLFGYGPRFIGGRPAAPAMPCDPARTRPA